MCSRHPLLIVVSHPRYRFIPNEVAEILGKDFDVRAIADPADIDVSALRRCGQARMFVPHWSLMIPRSIYESIETICFHMTDLPTGRGGSPLQNLILAGCKVTKLTAFRCTADLDGGPIYLKCDLSLEGRAEDILGRAAQLMVKSIIEITQRAIEPQPQVGHVTIFERRHPHQSRLPNSLSVEEVYDFIRMLDADGYPPAFMEVNGLRLQFRDAAISTASSNGETVVWASVRVSSRGRS